MGGVTGLDGDGDGTAAGVAGIARAAGAAGGGVPMARLLAMAYRELIDDMHGRLRVAGWTDVRPAYGFVLLAVRNGMATGSDLVPLLGMTKQAVSKLLEAMEASGYIERPAGAIGDDGRRRPVALAARGVALLAAVEELYAEIEAEWAAVIGSESLEGVRRDLVAVLRARHGGALPAVRPVW